MKHCAKKLLGLVFALALCLAVGGNALADGPEAADVWMLSDAWMLADEPNVTTAPDTTTVGDLANDGYTVTIPKTVEVDSTTNEGTLTVTAKLKQYRTLNIGIQSTNDEWQLKYNTTDEKATDVPKVKYTLRTDDSENDKAFAYYDGTTLLYGIGKIDTSEENYDAETKSRRFTTNFNVEVPTPSKATMSGTYSDTLTFTYTLAKHCVTYTINVYEQELNLKNDGTHIEAVDRVDSNGQLKDPTSQPKETYVLEYGCADVWGYSLGAAVTERDEWTRPRPAGTEGEEDTRCWENLSYTMTPKADYEAGETTQTINLNLKRKWYWLNVNGVVNSTGAAGESTDGNGPVGCYLDIRVSGNEGRTWSPWYWYKDGDDYWGTFPYGTTFEIGFHHPKEGYVYDTDESGNVKVIANGEIKYTTQEINNSSAGQRKIYKVFEGQLTGAPKEDKLISTTDGGNYHAEGSYQRYCFNVCCLNNTIVYARNDGTETTETRKYDEYAVLPKYDAVFDSVQNGAVFMGWSTKQTVTSEDKLYQPGVAVTNVQWTEESHKKLYAIWGRKVNITIQFEDEKGYTVEGTQKPVLGGEMSGYTVTLENQVIVDGADWVLDLNNAEVKNAIEAATDAAKKAAEDTDVKTGEELARKIWKIDQYTESGHEFNYTQVCKISAEKLQKGTTTLMIQRRRYLLSVLSAEVNTGEVLAVGKDPDHDEQGTFAIEVNGSTSGTGDPHTSFYQRGLNYGASYTVYDAKPLDDSGLYYAGCVILQSLKVGDGLGSSLKIEWTKSYSSHVTGKEKNIHYYTKNNPEPKDVYTGDPVRVAFWKTAPSSDTPVAGPTLAPGLSGPTVGDADADGDDTAGDTGEDITQPPAGTGLTLRYHANFVADDAVEEAVKTVACAPGADVVLKTCMFKRAGYTFTGWNTEKDGMGRAYKANGVPVTDWSDGDTVDLYAQWEKTVSLKPVVSGFDEDTGLFDPFAPPGELDPGFGIDPDADPADEEGPADDADAVDDAPAVADEEAAAAPPEELDFGFGIDPDAAVGGPAPFVRW